MSEKLTALWQSAGVRQSLLTTVGNLLATGLSAIALIIITRLLGPEKFGLFSVGFALALILNRLNDAGLNTVILKFASASKNAEERNRVYAAVLRYKLWLSLVLVVLGIVFAGPITTFLNVGQPELIIGAIIISLATTYFEHLITVLQSVHFFTQAVIAALLASSFKVIVALGAWLAVQTAVLPVFLLYMFGPLVPVLLFKRLLAKSFVLTLQPPHAALKNKVFKLAQHSSIALISAGIIENIDVLFLQKYLTSYETGLYGGVSRIALLFALIAYSLGNVLYPRVARYKTLEHLRPYLKKALGVVLLVLLGFLAFVPVAKFALLWTIGPDYLSGLPILIMLSAASFLAIAAVPFMALFYSFDADWYFSVSGLIQLAIVLIGNILFVPLYGLEAAAWTRLISRVFLLVFSAGLGWWLYQRRYARAL